MRIATFGLVLLAGLAVGACGSKVDDAVSGMKKYRDKMCACSDKDCAETVNKEYRDWRKDINKALKGEDKPSESVIKDLKDALNEYESCNEKARKGGDKK